MMGGAHSQKSVDSIIFVTGMFVAGRGSMIFGIPHRKLFGSVDSIQALRGLKTHTQ
jgi:hypothetical protein